MSIYIEISYYLYFIFLNQQHNSNKLYNFSKTEFVIQWIQLNYLIHVDHIQLHQENIMYLIMINQQLIHLDIIQVEWLDIDNQAKDLFIIQISHMMQVYGILHHQWSIKMILKQKISLKLNEKINDFIKLLKYLYSYI